MPAAYRASVSHGFVTFVDQHGSTRGIHTNPHAQVGATPVMKSGLIFNLGFTQVPYMAVVAVAG